MVPMSSPPCRTSSPRGPFQTSLPNDVAQHRRGIRDTLVQDRLLQLQAKVGNIGLQHGERGQGAGQLALQLALSHLRLLGPTFCNSPSRQRRGRRRRDPARSAPARDVDLRDHRCAGVARVRSRRWHERGGDPLAPGRSISAACSRHRALLSTTLDGAASCGCSASLASSRRNVRRASSTTDFL